MNLPDFFNVYFSNYITFIATGYSILSLYGMILWMGYSGDICYIPPKGCSVGRWYSNPHGIMNFDSKKKYFDWLTGYPEWILAERIRRMNVKWTCCLIQNRTNVTKSGTLYVILHLYSGRKRFSHSSVMGYQIYQALWWKVWYAIWMSEDLISPTMKPISDIPRQAVW